jgi:hypothetical protein
MTEKVDARVWLRQHGYPHVADLIEGVMEEWRSTGKGTRRDWWQVLAGDSKGRPRVIYGREFPVLRAAQIRQGKPVTDNAIWRDGEGPVPPKTETGRWGSRSH